MIMDIENNNICEIYDMIDEGEVSSTDLYTISSYFTYEEGFFNDRANRGRYLRGMVDIAVSLDPSDL